jgi:hypothetical protein
MGRNTLGLQSYLYKFDTVYKEQEGEAFSLTYSCVPTCPIGRASWHIVKIVEYQGTNFSRCKNNRQQLI